SWAPGAPASGMMVMALTPWATQELMSEMAFWRSPPAPDAMTLTFGHLAASERTAANEATDQAFTPYPSWMPRVMGLSPQNEVSGVRAGDAISASTVVAMPLGAVGNAAGEAAAGDWAVAGPAMSAAAAAVMRAPVHRAPCVDRLEVMDPPLVLWTVPPGAAD